MGILGKKKGSTTDTLLYTCPTNIKSVCSVNVLNTSAVDETVTISLVNSKDFSVDTIDVTNGGFGFTTIPTLTIVGSNTTLAVATVATMQLATTSTITAGSNYVVGDVVSGSGVTFTVASINAIGGITSLTITNGGSFATLPTATIALTGGTGTGAALPIAGLTFGIKKITVSNKGNGYQSAPTVTFSGTGEGVVLVVNMTTVVETIDAIEYNFKLASTGVLERTGIILSAGESIFVKSSSTSVNFMAYGLETIA